MLADAWITELENKILPMDDNQIKSLIEENKPLVKGFDIARAASQNSETSQEAQITIAKCTSLLMDRQSARRRYSALTAA